MTKSSQRPPRAPQVDPELLSSMAVPAPFVDRFYLLTQPGRVRLAFGEETAAGANYVSAVSMTHESAVQMMELLSRFVQRAPEDEKGRPD